jgi:2-amino-4-hydroxy-6-hydroxymethyldihydropteridine diphosphokinase
MTDQIHIEDLLLRTTLGIDDEQRSKRQDICIGLRLDTHTSWPGISDRVEDTVNYRSITKRVIRLVEQSRFYLMEKLAAEIAAICLDDPQVERVHVRVEKLGALRSARCVAVEIERTRADLVPRTHRAFITLRSSVESQTDLRAALNRLQTTTNVLALSPIYESVSNQSKHQKNFLNAATLVETPMTPAQLKQHLSTIENEFVDTSGGDPAYTVHLDIALYDNAIFDLRNRQIPAPGILTQAYIAIPLADLAPAYHHPQTKQPLEEIADALSKSNIHKTNITL